MTQDSYGLVWSWPSSGVAVRARLSVGGVRTWKQASRADYDANGRVTSSFDALDRQTHTVYTPASGGPVTQVQTINPLGHVITVTADSAFGPRS